ncbi:hypothetical protein P691DRAFT_758759 [Macrolepiota fuliginosa MF-IS2]|uniref:Uncharacterized protein n=1 Tax=Macrolepiota fuliginosa MF-IS2 TaxID=1400762 RepID=A0A9P5XHD4_9AGAR|nr:hypothetical protein P691DRAFT_758759 [Macrolepiota fuliginosa MF-IS2]
MPAYPSGYAPIFASPYLTHPPVSGIGGEPFTQASPPHAPRIRPIPLPPLDDIPAPTYQPRHGIYQFDILEGLTVERRALLQSILFTPPVHVHIPTAHIGTLHGSFTTSIPGQHVTALDIFLLLQSFATRPLDLYGMFYSLSPEMKKWVKAAYYRRMAVSQGVSNIGWGRFTSGEYGPLGVDLLLGNTRMWNLEARLFRRYSVVIITGLD